MSNNIDIETSSGTTAPAPAPDKYDLEVERLRTIPANKLIGQWQEQILNPGRSNSCLFDYCTVDGAFLPGIGCLTQVRNDGLYRAATPELTAAIVADNRLPKNEYGITHANLPVFAEWQRRLDRELREPARARAAQVMQEGGAP